jgi:hypothetical protein
MTEMMMTLDCYEWKKSLPLQEGVLIFKGSRLLLPNPAGRGHLAQRLCYEVHKHP